MSDAVFAAVLAQSQVLDGSGVSLPGGLPWVYLIGLTGALVALGVAWRISAVVRRESPGTDEMQRIAAAVHEGALAYLGAQYRVVAVVFVGLVIFLGGMAAFGLQGWWTLVGVPVAGLLSGLCGFFGMQMATAASARTANAAKRSLDEGLKVAFRAGAVMGLVVVGFALLDISVWFLIFNATGMAGNIEALTAVMLSFGMGASTQALFARVGGGIYTKAADVGADLVGKVEAGMVEDDPRNPATIADNVGDNVGDVAGMGADLYESYYGSMLATMALGAAAALGTLGVASEGAVGTAVLLASAPLAIGGIGVVASLAGMATVRAPEGATFASLLKGLHKGVYAASGLIALGTLGLFYVMFAGDSGTDLRLELLGTGWLQLWLVIIVGLVAGNLIAVMTEHSTSYEHKPTQRIAERAHTGSGTVIIAGIAEGMKSSWASLLTVVVAILLAFTLAGGNVSFLMGLYGVGIAAVGMLSTLGITLATDAYGPIADNAGGNAEMTGQDDYVRERTDMLDSLGNTTAATGKGFAIGSAALTALALFAAFIQVVQVQLATQARSYVEDNDAGAIMDAAADLDERGYTGMVAVYEGYGKFALVAPAETRGEPENVEPWTDAALLIAPELQGAPHAMSALKKGDILPIVGEGGVLGRRGATPEQLARSRSVVAVARGVDHGDHSHDFELELVSATRASIRDVLLFYDVTLTNPRVLGGIFIGVLLVFLFSALTMEAVGRAAYAMMNECRRQFGVIRKALRASGAADADVDDPTRWPIDGVEYEGTRYPDYARCVAISTRGAQREMVGPAAVAIGVPIAVGLVLGVGGVMGMLAGGLASGFALAVFMANAGGAWDNAKKLVESAGTIYAAELAAEEDARLIKRVPPNLREAVMAKAEELTAQGRGGEIVYGKGSDDHHAAVVGDTVGDPFKDTSGPALNILIKLISIVSVVFAGLTVAFAPVIGGLLGIGAG